MKNFQKPNKIFNIIFVLFLFCSFFFAFPFSAFADNTYSADFESSSNQYLSGGDILDITATTTISMWVNFETAPTTVSYSMSQTLMSKYSSSGTTRSYWLGVGGNVAGTSTAVMLLFSENGVDTPIGSVDYTFSTATWYHLTLVYLKSSGIVKVYLGTTASAPVQIGTMTGMGTSVYNSATAFQIGGISQQSIYFDGKIDDVRWFNSELSLAQIQDYYDCNLDAELSPDSQWKMDNDFLDGPGTNDLTNNNSVTFQSTSLPFTENCTIEEEPEEPTATTTEITGEPRFYDDIAIVSGFIEHYTTSTTTPSEIEHIIYKIPFLYWLIIFIPFLWVFTRLVIEFIIRLRQ